MAENMLDTLDELLEGVMNDVDDSDSRYKIRSARQLVEAIKQYNLDFQEATEDTVDDEEILENLRELGYID